MGSWQCARLEYGTNLKKMIPGITQQELSDVMYKVNLARKQFEQHLKDNGLQKVLDVTIFAPQDYDESEKGDIVFYIEPLSEKIYNYDDFAFKTIDVTSDEVAQILIPEFISQLNIILDMLEIKDKIPDNVKFELKPMLVLQIY